MALIKKLARFGLGIATGGAIGAAVGTLTAPDEGQNLRDRLRSRFEKAKQAGEEAKVRKQAQLITKYRMDVGSFDALEAVVDHSQPRADAMLATGYGRTAPEAIAAGQTLPKTDK
jgi:gas vesicle protein